MKKYILFSAVLIIFLSCKKETIIYKGAAFNEITFELRNDSLEQSLKQEIGVFTIDARGLPLLEIELEIEFATWDYEMSDYISYISLGKDSVDIVPMSDSLFDNGFCKYTWELIDTIQQFDTYHLNISTGESFEIEQFAHIQISFKILNLFNDIETRYGPQMADFPDKIYFRY